MYSYSLAQVADDDDDNVQLNHDENHSIIYFCALYVDHLSYISPQLGV